MVGKILKTNIAICIIAAGASKRMGTPKQLLKWGNQNLVGHALQQAQRVSEHVFVVLGAHYDRIAPTIASAHIINNKDWEHGMGSSIASGIKHITKTGQFTHILIMLADQPFLDGAYVNNMVDTLEKKPFGIIATQYENKFGVPAVFSSAYFSELMQLNQDFGARKLLQKYSDDIVGLSPGDRAMDIDTIEEYHRLKKYK